MYRTKNVSDGDGTHTGKPLPYQCEPEPSSEGDDIPVDVPNETIWAV